MKIGDKLYCKKTFSTGVGVFDSTFKEGEYYKILQINIDFITVVAIIKSPQIFAFNKSEIVNFANEKEVRKLKLDKIS